MEDEALMFVPGNEDLTECVNIEMVQDVRRGPTAVMVAGLPFTHVRMSAKPRCHDAAKAGIVGQQKGTDHEEQPKKPHCGCGCHERRPL